ncbi:Kef-type K+ transport system NAD-binding protein [Oleiphilus messinensis]|uniref:Kef-type K+ transport system NAD-binding protein n=1 Tax=Oleiphilus messinensis TaxID=141451 RepID=A0A1Y0IFL7_9GAMM|nr:potassium channel family protein [Oleiphilus messinensis]ARU58164.1 Kef-type K+ transport system NAD-binding protein [Oleiphilus messinensis]
MPATPKQLQRHFPALIGLAGVSPTESAGAIKVARMLDGPMVIMAVWIIIEWYLEASGHLSTAVVHVTDWIIWTFFIFETTALTILVNDKKNYLVSNWVNLLIIFLGFPVIWVEFPSATMLRVLRLIVMFGFLVQISTTARRILSRNHLGTTLIVGFVVMVMSGFLIAGLDPAFSSPWEGIWWAWVTVTTVGYGDFVPVSTAGRLFGAFLILMGIGLFSLLTANFSAFFVSRDEAEMIRRENKILAKLDRLENKLEHLEEKIEEMRTVSGSPNSEKKEKR